LIVAPLRAVGLLALRDARSEPRQMRFVRAAGSTDLGLRLNPPNRARRFLFVLLPSWRFR
jgi:hypothetical protein